MRTVLRILVGILALLVVAIAGLAVAARFSDGPIAIFAGGPFESGELVSGPEPDWSFVRDVQEVEFQLLTPPRSRTTWILYHEGKAYIPCGYMTSWWGKLWKQWPREAEQDPRIILRVGDQLYERKLVRIQDGPAIAPLLAEATRKYLPGTEIPPDVVSSGQLWLYELAPRVAGMSALADQRTAGLVMKAVGDPILWLAMSVIFFRWARAEQEADRREREARRAARAG